MQKYQREMFMQLEKSTIYSHNPSFIYSWSISHNLEHEFFYLGQLHCKYIDRKYYDILLCLIYHRNLVIICAAGGRIQPMIVPSTVKLGNKELSSHPKIGKLVTGNGSLIPISSLSKRSLLPSLTVL